MRPVAALSLAVLLVGGCQCLVPVEQCAGADCLDAGGTDAGEPDAAVPDGGGGGGAPDAGPTPDAGPFDCGIWDGGNVGKCAAVTGYVFDGTVCRGECVLYPITSAGVFPSVADCVDACALPYCNASLLAAVLPQPFVPGAYCDDLQVSTSLPWLVEEAFPELDAGCLAQTGATTCTLLRSQVLGDAGYLEACAATLLPETTQVICHLYGP
jgi:hypothetical protein